VAPATANIIGKAANGIADDLVSTTILTVMTTVPILMAPAMNTRMWENPAVKRNVEFLRSCGVRFVGPEEGRLADGRSGMGRMSEVEEILKAAELVMRK
jgi:phosphopantothenoylcysteine synthetase/decarboxylase